MAPDPNGLPSITEPDPAIVIGELDNGLRYLIRDNDNPGGRVDMRLVVDAGSALEDDTQTGGAHFLEHMVFKGTKTRSAARIAEAGDEGVLEWRSTGRLSAGRDIDYQGVSLLTFDGDRVSRFATYYDTAAFIDPIE